MKAALVDMFGQILECWKCYIRSICNIGTCALPDIYTLALRRCAPSGFVRTY